MFFVKLQICWNIFLRSLSLLNREKKLLIFPVISFCASVLLLILICAGTLPFLMKTDKVKVNETKTEEIQEIPDEKVLTANSFRQTSKKEIKVQVKDDGSGLYIAVYFVLYYLTMLIANFCTTAFFSEVFAGLYGSNVCVSRGFRTAWSRIRALLLWTLLAAVAGTLIQALRGKKCQVVRNLICSLIGAAWAVVSCFAIPIIALNSEIVNPFSILKKSTLIIRKTWGENLTGYMGMKTLGAVIVYVMLIPFAVGLTVMNASASPGMKMTGAVIWIGSIVLTILFLTVLHIAGMIFRAVLYLYADGANPRLFTQEELDFAFE